MTQKTALDTAGHVNISVKYPDVQHADASHGILLAHILNGNIGSRSIRQFSLSWSVASNGLARNVLDHWESNAHKAFKFNLAGGEEVDVIYQTAPQFQQRTATSTSITVTLEEAPITD